MLRLFYLVGAVLFMLLLNQLMGIPLVYVALIIVLVALVGIINDANKHP